MPLNINKTLANKNTAWPPLSLGRFYSSPTIGTLTTLTLTVNTLYAIPIVLSEAVIATSINLEVTTQSAGNNARLGIYSDNNGVPSSLILDAGTISLTGTGGRTVAISNLNMPATWYWLAVVSNGAAAVRALSQTGAMPMLGFSSATDTTVHVGWSVAFTYAALPNPFTGGGALMAGAAPRILLGV